MQKLWDELQSRRRGSTMRPTQSLGAPDEEVVIDLGKTSSTIHTNFEKEELESHRAVYVGVHVPLGRESRRRHRHRGHKQEKKRRERDSEDGRDSPTYATPPQINQGQVFSAVSVSSALCPISICDSPHSALSVLGTDAGMVAAADTPSQRVQFILGMEDDDEEHVSHDLFTEMDELTFLEGKACEWKETARWLKFEEDVEDGGERWSKPYVATLSLHSLFELRNYILNGTVMLDMRADSIEEIADMLLDSMMASGQLKEEVRDKVREAMLKRHHFQNERKLSNRIPLVRSFADIGKKHSDPHLLERNGEGLSASRLSLLRRSSSITSVLQRRESRPVTPSVSPAPSPAPTPVPPSRHSLRPHLAPPCDLAGPELGPFAPWCNIPEVIIHPPEETDDEQEAWSQEDQAGPETSPHRLSLLYPLSTASEGLLASPQSAPGGLEHSKPSENRTNCNNGSRENSTVDFSRVDMNFMRKIPSGAEASNVLVGEVDFLEQPIIAFVRLSPAVLLTGLTEVPVPTRFLFLLLGPHRKPLHYHEIGRSIATLMTDQIFHDVAYKAKDRNDLLSGIDEFLDQVMVLPPGEWDPSIRIEPPKSVPSQEKRKIPTMSNGLPSSSDVVKEMEHHGGPELQRTGRCFGGLVSDVRRKAPFYWSDIRDSLSLQCLASILFLYCACMSPVITFGGLLGEATKGNISAIESLFGASLTGVAFSLFAGQPLTILGSTGPVLVFEKILFKFCKDYSLSYLSLRTSIGLWTAFLCLVLVATDASSLVCYITRFTEEAFASLICIIFIYEALEKLADLGRHFPINMNNNVDNLTFYSCQCSAPANSSPEAQQSWNMSGYTSDSIPWSSLNVTMCKELHGEFVGAACGQLGPYIPDVLFWSIILFFTTFFLSSFLKQFKTKRYFPTKVRSTISDFAVFLTILIMVVVDFLVGIPSPKLQVPDSFEPTSKNRGWLISPLGDNPWWTLLAAAIPALLCTILIFMDQQITAVIINRKEHKLKKGGGYHLDLLVVSVMLGICSIMGLPWFVAATVLSISHVNSLKLESECSAPGEQPKFLGIREQRVTGFMIFVLMGLSVFMTSVLKFIPMPVLYGVFLYMGVSSLKGIQLFDRIKLFGMPTKHQPDLIYLRYVPLWKVHIFTIIQLSCLVLLWVIKVSVAAVIFPMMVLALVFVRKLLDFCFTKRELSFLDDLMPESKKKKDDDKKKELQEAENTNEEEDSESSQFSLKQRGILKIPVKSLKSSSDPSTVNISAEMPKTSVWKAVASGKRLKPSARQETPSIKINIQDENGEKLMDAETLL